MAIVDKHGMVRGLVGNIVYRVVNGKGVIQTRPKPRKSSGGTLVENEQFADSSKLSVSLYPLLKDFGWNRCYSYLYGKLVTYVKRFLHGDLADAHEGEYLAMDKNNGIRQLFKRLPSAIKNDNTIDIHVPALVPFKADHRMAYAEFLSYEVVLLGAFIEDMSVDSLEVLDSLETEIFRSSGGHSEQRIKLDLEQLDGSEINLLIVALRTKLLEDKASSAFSNSKEANPVGILGLWRL